MTGNTFIGTELAQKLEKLISDNPDANIFCDETPIGGTDGIDPDYLKAIARKVSTNNLFWIACNHSHPPKDSLAPGKTLYINRNN